ncbi:MAG: ECF transporter S component [Coriobacteriia bacterium]|nr:ECF transporter S component [Coriobacteriia bacterium]
MKLRDLLTAALLMAAGVVLNMVLRIPLIPSAPFLEYSPADVPTLLGTFALGPVFGMLIGLGRAVLHFALGSTGGPVGLVMDAASSVMLAGVAGLIYLGWKTRGGAAVALLCGSLAMTAVVVALNYFWAFPAFGAPAQLVWTTALPFNLIKSAINVTIVFLLYKPLSAILHGRKSNTIK